MTKVYGEQDDKMANPYAGRENWASQKIHSIKYLEIWRELKSANS